MARGRKGENQKARRQLVKPESLTPAQGKLWEETIAGQSAGWLVPGMETLLQAYVVSACYLRRLYAKRETALEDPDSTPKDITAYDIAIGAEVRNVAMLMTRLRLTPQSRQDRATAKDRPPAPWEDLHPDDDGDTE
jgi:hypothetical protein